MSNELLETLFATFKVGEPGWSILWNARYYLANPVDYLRGREYERTDHECCMPLGFWGSSVHDFYMDQEHEQNIEICGCEGCTR